MSRPLIGATVAAVAMLVMACGCDGSTAPAPKRDVRLSAPSYIDDPVPKPKVLSKADLPDRCGVGAARLHRYVPGDDGYFPSPGWCQWSDATRHRKVEIEVRLRYGEPVADQSADGHALRDLDPADIDLVPAGHAEKPVRGLGDEALYSYSTGTEGGAESGSGATLRLRVGATVATVAYRGARLSTGDRQAKQLPEKEARPAVLAVAADVARALHGPAKPVVTDPPVTVPPPAVRTVRPCDLVPAALADRLVPRATRGRGQVPTEDIRYGEVGDACTWTAESDDGGPDRWLSVAVIAESEWRPGIAVAQATRRYLELHEDARAAATGFHAVRGLGDQAYAAYGKLPDSPHDGTSAEVAFRRGGMVVEVGYSGSAGRTDRATVVNGAYTVATRALKGLR